MADYPRLEVVQVGTGDNRFSMRMESELLDRMQLMREINTRMTEAFLDARETAAEELLGDLDNWQPLGILNTPMRCNPPLMPEDGWPLPDELEEAVRDHLRDMMITWDRNTQNARAIAWWRSQRRQRMTLDEAMAKIDTEYGTALELLGRM